MANTKTAAELMKQQNLEGMKPKKIEDLEKLCIEWRDAVAVHKAATEDCTKAKLDVRKYMVDNDVTRYFVEGAGMAELEDPPEPTDFDVVWKPIKRKKEKPNAGEAEKTA